MERPLSTAEHGHQVLEVLVDWFVHVHLVFMVANNMHACLLLVSFYYIYYIMVVVELDGSGAYIGTSSLWYFLIIGNNSTYIDNLDVDLKWYFSFTTAQNIFTACSKADLARWGKKWRMILR